MGIKVKCRERFCKECGSVTVHTTYKPGFWPDGFRWTIVLVPFLCLLGPVGFLLGMLIPYPLVYHVKGPPVEICDVCETEETRSELLIKIVVALVILLVPLFAIMIYANFFHTPRP